MFTEQRRHARLPLDGSIILKTKNGRLVATRGRLDDLSLGGFRMSSSEELEIGKDVEFFVRSRSLDDRMSGRGIIKNMERTNTRQTPSYRVGIQFMDVDRTTIEKILDKKRHGWDKRADIRRHKEDLWLALKCAPALILVCWMVLGSFWQINAADRADSHFNKQFRSGILHFLYNAE
jgi:hypothetical protein